MTGAATTHRRIRGVRDEMQTECRGKISSISSEESPRDYEDMFPIGKTVCEVVHEWCGRTADNQIESNATAGFKATWLEREQW